MCSVSGLEMLRDNEIENRSIPDKKMAAIPIVVEPKRHKAKLLVWTDLSFATIDRLNESPNPDHIKQVLADIFMLDHYKTDPVAAIIMELFYNTLRFAKREKFSSESTSAFFSIIKRIFQVCVETPFRNEAYTYGYFKDLMQCHSVNHPPCSVSIFTPEEALKITKHTERTFFKHFSMYKHAFTSTHQLDLFFNYSVELPSQSPSPVDHEVKIGDSTDHVTQTQQQKSGNVSGRGSNDMIKIKDVKRLALAQSKKDLELEIVDTFSMEAKKFKEIITAHMTMAADYLGDKLSQMIHTPVLQVSDTEMPFQSEESALWLFEK